MDEIRENPMYRYLIMLTIASAVGLQAWQTLFNNFAVEVAGLEGKHVGVIQSVREIPGFLALLAIYVMLVIKEHRLSALSILLLGCGLGLTGLFPTFTGLTITTLISSFGFHYYETTNQSLTLQYFNKVQAPQVFGRQYSIAAASNIGIGLFIFLVSFFLYYSMTYMIIGLFIVGVALWGFGQNPERTDLAPQRKRMVLRKKYWLFYFLTFMAGARRQIFMAFAVFLLVKRFEYSVQEVTILFVVNNVIRYYLSPLIAKSIVRFGERKLLSLEYASLIIVFLAYAYVDNRLMVAFLYVLDHIFFGFAMAIQTYFQKVADPRDIAPSMAVGFTINHIAAVVLPTLGGLLWMLDYRIPFIAGACMSIVSLAAVQLIRIDMR
ncbi:MAG: MFS transporter [Deltaproteobacteria bacterium]|nr:MFS transporter [Deltaproteobacteria bacterium]